MRWGIAFLALVALSGCIPHADRGREPPRRPGPVSRPLADRGSPDTLQCHIDLAREHIQFRRLPDQRFAGGCSSVGAVQLVDMGTPATGLRSMTCPLARQFARWSRESVQPAADQWLHSRVVRIETFGTYACRPRNNQAGERLSEHAFANAVDVSAFVLADGRRVTVQQGWRGGDERVQRFLRQIHQGGCRRFAIGLSPDANRFHYNHMHFDMGANGPYCR
jgi:hypothetical protein